MSVEQQAAHAPTRLLYRFAFHRTPTCANFVLDSKNMQTDPDRCKWYTAEILYERRKHGEQSWSCCSAKRLSESCLSSGMFVFKVANKNIYCERQQHKPNLSVCVVHYCCGRHRPGGTRRIHLQQQLRPRVLESFFFLSRFDVVNQLRIRSFTGTWTSEPGCTAME